MFFISFIKLCALMPCIFAQETTTPFLVKHPASFKIYSTIEVTNVCYVANDFTLKSLDLFSSSWSPTVTVPYAPFTILKKTQNEQYVSYCVGNDLTSQKETQYILLPVENEPNAPVQLHPIPFDASQQPLGTLAIVNMTGAKLEGIVEAKNKIVETINLENRFASSFIPAKSMISVICTKQNRKVYESGAFQVGVQESRILLLLPPLNKRNDRLQGRFLSIMGEISTTPKTTEN